MPDPSPHPPAGDGQARLRAQVKEAVDRERRRLAEGLHLTASQSLTAAYYHALVLASQSPDAPGHAADLAALPDMIHRAIDELREVTREFQEPDR